MTETRSQGTSPYQFVPYHRPSMTLEAQIAALQLYLATMLQRRTIRDYSDKPVPFELIENAIRAAGLAPSGANQQPWTFVVVSDPDLKRQIREAAEAEERES